MIEKVKQTTSEKLLLTLFIILGIIAFYIFVILPQKCLFIKNYDPQEIRFDNPENIAVLNVNCGNVIIKLYPDTSPKSVERFRMLINSGKYNNIAFHRVIKNVIVQAGDLEFGKKDNLNYLYIGTGKSGFGTIKSELNDETEFKAGTVGMARTNKLNTEDSQFFILLEDAPLFKGEYTPVGKVVYGLEVLDTIADDHRREYVLRPDFINSFKLLID
jgi:peptidyl-prolyl cis-trans isomerase A (cyclophilin A)